jgi:hypothetical protein
MFSVYLRALEFRKFYLQNVSEHPYFFHLRYILSKLSWSPSKSKNDLYTFSNYLFSSSLCFGGRCQIYSVDSIATKVVISSEHPIINEANKDFEYEGSKGNLHISSPKVVIFPYLSIAPKK